MSLTVLPPVPQETNRIVGILEKLLSYCLKSWLSQEVGIISPPNLRFQSTVFWVAIYNEKKKKEQNTGSEYLGSAVRSPSNQLIQKEGNKALHFTRKSERVRLILVMLKLFLRAQGS